MNTSTQEISENPLEGDAAEEISEKQNEGSIPQEITEEHKKEGDAAEEISEKQNEGSIPQEITEAHKKEVTVEKMTATMADAEKIFNLFKDKPESKIILNGKAGVGKTWIARAICKFVLDHGQDEPLWISLDKKHDDQSLYDTIARRFSFRTSADAREEDKDENEKKEKTVKSLEDIKEEKFEELKKKLKELVSQPKMFLFLIVLDGQVEETTDGDPNKEILKTMLGLDGMDSKIKYLITRRDEDGRHSQNSKQIEVEPLSEDEARRLFKENTVDRVEGTLGFNKLCKEIKTKTNGLPAEVLILAGTLNYIAAHNRTDLKYAFELATNDLSQLLRYAYDKEPADPLIDCFWHSWHFLGKHGGIHYNELITNWIMEGCLKREDHIEKAYELGHDVLMKLVDYHLLKMQEDNVVVLERATLNMNDFCRRGYTGSADPGLASVFKDCDSKVLDGIAPADGMMKTLCGDKKEEMISSLVIDGSRVCRAVHEDFFADKHNLRMLAIFKPRLRLSEEISTAKMENLLALVLRGSYLLKDMNHVENFKSLAVLEISGSNYLKEIPKELFHHVSKLRSLNLTAAAIGSLPSTFTELTELRRLILRKCSGLQSLPKLAEFKKLEVIDLSECSNLKKIQEKSFNSLENLQVIDFSYTSIEKLPIVRSLKNLKIILLKGCSHLSNMRTVKNVSSLKVLDLSGAGNVKEIMYGSFEGTEELRELDLSGTQIQFLPPDICNLQKLKLKDCSSLKVLPDLTGHNRLEELDLSGCKELTELPDLSAVQNLKILHLKDCINLKSTIPGLKSLLKLEWLDLSGTNLCSQDVEDYLKSMPRLQILK